MLSVFASCTKTPTGGRMHQLESFYSTATIDGNEVEFSENENGFVNGYGKAGVWVQGMGQWFERQSTVYSKNGENIFNIYFMKWVNANPPAKEDIKTIFRKGNYDFGSSDFNNLVEGVEIRYIDEAGVEWTTRGDQTGSHFEVTDHAKNEADSYTPYITEGTFSCKFYNNLGESKTVTNGQFKGRTVVYY
jgi:hypothetical protein